jgi:putative hydrolase of the HAD superfamily
MERNYLQYITKFLSDSSEMMPEPTLLKPLVEPDGTIKAVAFDVYGTILISASGDIDESVISAENFKAALDASGIVLAETVLEPEMFFTEVLEEFKNLIKTFHQTARSDCKPYPEINILEIWEKIIMDNNNRNRLILSGPLCIKCFTFVFEVLSNRIYPMPGMKDVINNLAERKFPLGLISNAQFYTPVILNFFLHDTITESEQVEPFDPDLTIFSYQHQRSKPDAVLFEHFKTQCRNKFGIHPDEILFIGNDMLRDVFPARMAGFKTALFAGDTKSLRLRPELSDLKGITPDYVITELRQLFKILL